MRGSSAELALWRRRDRARESNPSRAGALENFQLMTQDDDLELQRGAASDAAENAIDEIKQDLSHGPTLREVAAKD